MAEIQTVATDIGQVSINPQGEYSAGTQYHVLDVVTYNGSSYISVKDSLNKPVSNTTYWYLLASKGDTYEVTPEDLQAIADQITQDASSAFNQNVTAKTDAFNQNASQKVSDFNSNATSKTTDFNSNATSKTTDFNSNATSKTNTFNTNATEKTTAFDGNYTDKLGLFNGNATDKTTAFNNNATDKTTDFNNNATSKTTDFNDNATSKTTTFNANAQDKVDYYNTNADSLIALSGGVLEQIPTAEVNNTVISVDDSAGEIPPKDIAILGNTSQATDVLTYTCIGTELGDYYFVYEDTNYQFTMPAISAGSVLVFNTTTLKLYQGDTEIETTTASTGTLITLNATPNPDYPQDIKVVTGNVTVLTSGKNLFNIAEASCLKGDINAFLKTNDTIRIINQGSAPSGNYEWVVVYAIDVKDLKGKTITLSANIKPVSDDKAGRIYLALRNSILDLKSGTSRYTSLSSISYDIPEELDEYHYLAISLYGTTNGAGGEYVDYSDIQIEFGSTATTFEPYQGKNVTLPLGTLELAKTTEFQDVLFKNSKDSYYYNSTLTENAWYKLSQIGKKQLTGEETVNNNIIMGTVKVYSISRSGFANLGSGTNNNANMVCNYFTAKIPAETNYGDFCVGATAVNFCKDQNEDTTAFKNWLAEAKPIIYYILSSPRYTQITDTALLSKLEELANSSTYKLITNIYTSTDNEEPNIDIVYRKDLTKMFSDLSNAILSLGNNT